MPDTYTIDDTKAVVVGADTATQKKLHNLGPDSFYYKATDDVDSGDTEVASGATATFTATQWIISAGNSRILQEHLVGTTSQDSTILDDLSVGDDASVTDDLTVTGTTTSGDVAVTGPVNITGATAATGYIQQAEVATDVAAPAANKAVIYTRDNGSGKTQLVARFPTGAVQQIAIEP